MSDETFTTVLTVMLTAALLMVVLAWYAKGLMLKIEWLEARLKLMDSRSYMLERHLDRLEQTFDRIEEMVRNKAE